jgi:ComF family protein
MEKMFWGKIPIERGASYFHYHKGSDYRHIIFRLKYRGQKEIGEEMGRRIATELSVSGFFDDIDLIVPIPLHSKRQRSRGYNQSEWIAKGVSSVTGIPLNTEAVRRGKETETQTSKSAITRWDNVRDVFETIRPDLVAGRHILIVDDVLTTGSTITSCASSIMRAANDVRFSVLTMAMAD